MLYSLLLATALTLGRRDTTALDTSALLRNNKGLLRIVVTGNGDAVWSRSYNGHPDTALCNNQSLTKSVVSLLIGIAIDKGYIPSVDEPIVRYFPSLASDPDPRKRHIRIRDIMNQASGLWHEDLDKLEPYLSLPDPSGFVLSQPLLSDPGAVFHYNNAATHLLSVILTRATGQTTLAFAQTYLFGPLSIAPVQWDKMRDGYYDGCGLLSLHTRTDDMNRIGTLLLTGGVYRGRRIVSKAWIDSLLHPTRTYPTTWGFQGSRYALCYYHYTYAGEDLTYGLGWGGQFLVVVPSRGVVVTVNQDPRSWQALRHSIEFTNGVWAMLWKML
jgi:CubicO group peptidase (beta-lactamase class C family)